MDFKACISSYICFKEFSIENCEDFEIILNTENK